MNWAVYTIQASTTYIAGSFNTKVCPEARGFVKITSEAACQTAASSLGLQYDSAGSWTVSPSGCVSSKSTNRVYYNTDQTNAIASDLRPICKEAQYDFVATGVARTVMGENWLGLAWGSGVQACYEAVLADSECVGDYFSYATRGDQSCGCKASGPGSLKPLPLVIRSDTSVDYYRMQAVDPYSGYIGCYMENQNKMYEDRMPYPQHCGNMENDCKCTSDYPFIGFTNGGSSQSPEWACIRMVPPLEVKGCSEMAMCKIELPPKKDCSTKPQWKVGARNYRISIYRNPNFTGN